MAVQAARAQEAKTSTPGGRLNQKLTAWWTLDFPALRAELGKVFKIDIASQGRVGLPNGGQRVNFSAALGWVALKDFRDVADTEHNSGSASGCPVSRRGTVARHGARSPLVIPDCAARPHPNPTLCCGLSDLGRAARGCRFGPLASYCFQSSADSHSDSSAYTARTGDGPRHFPKAALGQ